MTSNFTCLHTNRFRLMTPEEESLEMRDMAVLVLTLAACLTLCGGAPVISTEDQEKAEEYLKQALYGARNSTGGGVCECTCPQPTSQPHPSPPEPCDKDLVFDAAINIRNELYFFKNNYYWKKSTLLTDIPQTLISSTWPSITSVDAAYELKGKSISYFFKGQNYWAVTATSVLPGYPKHVSHFGFPASVTKIDAAVHVDSTRRTLFFTGDKYWSFDELIVKMDAGFPKFINADFPGIGNKVDAAFENGGFLYFSDGAKQTEYKYSSKSVNRVILNYGWLNCY